MVIYRTRNVGVAVPTQSGGQIPYVTQDPLDRFSKLDYSTSESMSMSERVSLERSRRQLSENVPVGIGTVLGAE